MKTQDLIYFISATLCIISHTEFFKWSQNHLRPFYIFMAVSGLIILIPGGEMPRLELLIICDCHSVISFLGFSQLISAEEETLWYNMLEVSSSQELNREVKEVDRMHCNILCNSTNSQSAVWWADSARVPFQHWSLTQRLHITFLLISMQFFHMDE